MIVIVDFNNINSKNDIHNIIRNSFNFEYYGNNFDSLYDNLSSITYELDIVIKNIDKVYEELKSYINIFKNVLNDIMDECDNIKVRYE